MIHITSKGGIIGRIHWINSDTRQACSSFTSWGDTWWHEPHQYDPACGTGGVLLQNPPYAGGEG